MPIKQAYKDYEGVCKKLNEDSKILRQKIVEIHESVETKYLKGRLTDATKNLQGFIRELTEQNKKVAKSVTKSNLREFTEKLKSSRDIVAKIDQVLIDEITHSSELRELAKLSVGNNQIEKDYQHTVECFSRTLATLRECSTQLNQCMDLAHAVTKGAEEETDKITQEYIPHDDISGKHPTSVTGAIQDASESITEAIASYNFSPVYDPGSSMHFNGSAERVGDIIDLKSNVERTVGNLLGTTLPLVKSSGLGNLENNITTIFNRSFEKTQKNGREVFNFKKSTSSVNVINGEQVITGTQATLLEYFKSNKTTIAKLVNELRPEGCECDPALVSKHKQAVEESLNRVIEVFAQEGGPDGAVLTTMLQSIKTNVDILSDLLGINRIILNSPYDIRDNKKDLAHQSYDDIGSRENNQANLAMIYYLLTEMIKVPCDFWLTKSKGIKLARLSHVVQAMPATVHQINNALDMAGVHRQDRIVEKPLGDLLATVLSFAEKEWIPMLRDRDANTMEVSTIHDMASRLHTQLEILMGKLSTIIAQGRGHVQRSLLELLRQLELTESLTDDITNHYEVNNRIRADFHTKGDRRQYDFTDAVLQGE